MLSIFMDKAAKKNFSAVRKSRKLQNNTANMPPAIDIRTPVESVALAPTPSVKRQALIRNAVDVHKECSKVFDNLSDDQKQRLQLLARHVMSGKLRKSHKAQNKSTNLPPATYTKAPEASVAVAQTPNIKRQTLIRKAMAAHKEHSKVLDNLSGDQKKRLQRLAMHTMLGKINS